MTAPLLPRLRSLLESRRLPLAVAVVGAVLTAPSLFGGLATEDWIQRALIDKGEYPLPERVNLFGHATRWGIEEIAKRNFEYQLYGWFPWITDRSFDASFWRPLASLTHHADYRLWRAHPVVMHAQSLAWYAALVAAVAVLHRRVMGSGWIAGLAAVLYAVDDAHGHPVGWLVNRNAVMATFFAVLALVAYDRFRRERFLHGAWLTGIFLALGLGSAEFALCSLGYFAAHVLFLDPAPPRRRLLPALAWALPALLWGLLYRRLGHGTYGSGLYIDPQAEPLSYAFELLERAAILCMGQLGAPAADAWTHSGLYAQGLLVFWATALVSAVGWVLWPLLRTSRVARFWAAGALLSLPPACATFSEDRLLLFTGIGAMPLVAATIAPLVTRKTWTATRPRSAAVLAAAWVGLHALAAPVLLPYRSLHMARYDRDIQEAARSAFAFVKESSADALLVVNGENFYVAGMMPLTRVARGERSTQRVLTLAGTLEETFVRRIDESTLEVRPRHGFLSRAFNRIYRGKAHPVPRGRVVNLLGVEVTVTEVNEWGEPMGARFRFALPLEASIYKWVVWHEGRYVPFTPPPVGAQVRVGGA